MVSTRPVDTEGPQLAALLLNAQKLSLHLLKDKLQGKEKDPETLPIIQGRDFPTDLFHQIPIIVLVKLLPSI